MKNENGKWTKKRIVSLALGIVMASTGTYSLVKQVQYQGVIKTANIDLVKANNDLVDVLIDWDVDEASLTSTGNSIGAGYSGKDKCAPLLRRNESLSEMLKEENINVYYNEFARMRDNSDEHTFNMAINDIKQSMLNKEIVKDYEDNPNLLEKNYITKEDIQKYYPLVLENDKSLNEIILNTNGLNVIVYNGGFGSFLDALTRGGNVWDAFDRDAASVEAFFQYVYLKNPKTQIYFCGIPNLLNLDFPSSIVNNRYKQMCAKYPNITYVESAPLALIYNNGKDLDMHYSEQEYWILNKNITMAIAENCVSNDICSDLSMAFRTLNEKIQFDNRELKGNENALRLIVNAVLEAHSNVDDAHKKKGLEKFISMYKERQGSDFFYIAKDKLYTILYEYIKTYTSKYPAKK